MRLSISGTAAALAIALGAMVAPAAVAAQNASPAQADVAPSAFASAIQRRATGIDDSGSYRLEVQACREGRTQQSLATCLTEARNAHADRVRGRLASDAGDYTANALARCHPFIGEARAACEGRVLGFGTTTGSVEGGGLLRTLETVVLPPGDTPVVVFPRTADPVVLAPSR